MDYYEYCHQYHTPGCCVICPDERKERHRTGYDEKCMCYDMKCSKCEWLRDLGDVDPDTGRAKNTCTHSDRSSSWTEPTYSRVIFDSVIRQTKEALLIRFDSETQEWIPKSLFYEPDEISDWIIDQKGLGNFRYRKPRRNTDSIIITLGGKEFVAKKRYKGGSLNPSEYIIICPICHEMYVTEG